MGYEWSPWVAEMVQGESMPKLNRRASMLLQMFTLSCWNGAERINAHVMNGHVPMLPIMVTWICWNGPKQINAHGMNGHVPMLPSMATLSCWNGRGQMGVLGTDTYIYFKKEWGSCFDALFGWSWLSSPDTLRGESFRLLKVSFIVRVSWRNIL